MKRSHSQMDSPRSSSRGLGRDRQSALQETGHFKTKAIDVEEDIRNELEKYVYNSTEGFIEAILDVPQTIIDEVYNTCIRVSGGEQLYTPARGQQEAGQWRGYPTRQPSKEVKLYEPFVKIADKVTTICRDKANARHEPVNNVKWIDQHSHVPPATQVFAADLRPDIVATIGNIPGNGAVAPWRRILAPLEVKKDHNDKPALLQLLMYQRQLFREAVDRRFFIGFTLGYRKMRVYLADRSGVLGSEVFDINAHPKKLIRVMAALETLPLHKLGWDTTMHALAKDQGIANVDPQSLPLSHAIPYQGAAMDHYFVIGMPPAKSKTDAPVPTGDPQPEFFVLYESLSLFRGEFIVGRATRVWKAWSWSDMHLPKEKRALYIIKDTWRDAERGLEGDIYDILEHCEGVAVMHSYAAVFIDGSKDTTLSFIRRGFATSGNHIQVAAPQKIADSDAIEAIPHESPEERHKTTRYVIDQGDYLPEDPDADADRWLPRERVHSRLVMKTYGWPAKNAKSPLELATVLRDAINGHYGAYTKGVLHRDISANNILIVVGGRGVLIDFDNAIILSIHEAIPEDPLTGTLPFMSGELLGHVYFRRKDATGPPVHYFIHDLESFLWVLVWICLTREGPAKRRRDLSSTQQSEQLSGLRQIVIDLFEGDKNVLMRTKRLFIYVASERDLVDDELLCYVSDFMAPLKDLIFDFLALIRIAYKDNRRDAQAVYEDVLRLFDKHIRSLKEGDPSELFKKLREDEDKRRANDIGNTWDTSPNARRTAQPSSDDETEETYDDDQPLSPTPKPKRLRPVGPLSDTRNAGEGSSSSSSPSNVKSARR